MSILQVHVGATVLGENGKIYTVCNIENASYGMTEFCASMDSPIYVAGPSGDTFHTHTMEEICPYPFQVFTESKDYHN